MARVRVKPKSIFVSSTFRDMQAERDALRDVVLPRVNAFAARYGSQVELIDLRWGVDTGNISEAEQTSKVLRTCLDEIQRSRPFFIGLLGDRYGWVPPLDEMKAAALEAGFDMADFDKSVTALEIEYGALHSPDRPVSLFYFREMDPSGMDAETLPVYRDGDLALEKQNALKAEVAEAFRGYVKPYTARFEGGHVLGLEAFAAMAAEDIIAALAEEWGEAPETPPSEEESEELAQELFRQAHTELVIGLDEHIRYWKENCLEDRSEYLAGAFTLLRCEAGGGKSTFLCGLMEELEGEDCLLLPYICGVTPRSSTVEGMLRGLILKLERFLAFEHREYEEFSMVQQHFNVLLELAAKEKRVVVLIDGLEQISTGSEAWELQWLRYPNDKNICIMASITDGPEVEAAHRKSGYVHERVLFRPEHARALIEALAAKHHKQLSPEVIEHILLKSCSNPQYLSLLVRDLMMMDRYEHAVIDGYVKDGMPAMAAINRFMKELIDKTPADPEGAFLAIATRAERLVGEEFAGTALNAIALSRRGLREQDLEGLFQKLGVAWNAADFAWLRQLLGGEFVQGDAFVWDFAHQNYRKALRDERWGEIMRVNRALTDWFYENRAGDAFINGEILYHMYYAGDYDRAADVLHAGGEEYCETYQQCLVEIYREQEEEGDERGSFAGNVIESAVNRSESARQDVYMCASILFAFLPDDEGVSLGDQLVSMLEGGEDAAAIQEDDTLKAIAYACEMQLMFYDVATQLEDAINTAEKAYATHQTLYDRTKEADYYFGMVSVLTQKMNLYLQGEEEYLPEIREIKTELQRMLAFLTEEEENLPFAAGHEGDIEEAFKAILEAMDRDAELPAYDRIEYGVSVGKVVLGLLKATGQAEDREGVLDFSVSMLGYFAKWYREEEDYENEKDTLTDQYEMANEAYKRNASLTNLILLREINYSLARVCKYLGEYNESITNAKLYETYKNASLGQEALPATITALCNIWAIYLEDYIGGGSKEQIARANTWLYAYAKTLDIYEPSDEAKELVDGALEGMLGEYALPADVTREEIGYFLQKLKGVRGLSGDPMVKCVAHWGLAAYIRQLLRAGLYAEAEELSAMLFE